MLLRVLVAVDDPPLAERVLGLLHGAGVITRASGLARALTGDTTGDGCDVVVFAAPTTDELSAHVEQFRSTDRPPEVIAISSTEDPEDSAAALANGSLGVLSSALEDDELTTALDSLLERARTLRQAYTEIALAAPSVDELIVVSPAMRRVVDTAKRAARSASTILIAGETGVGKERIAQLVHTHSPRADHPFIPINCAAIPSELVESELFGHARGAFTGAHQARKGYFELAHGGTLFLDEIAELPLAAQAKLLRVLQDRQLRPVGSDRLIPVDVRLVAATNRDLAEEVAAGRYRADLFYRLRVVELELPALRDRPEDIEPLLDAQLHRFNASLGRSVSGFTAAASRALRSYTWPGNVRELINVVERAVLLCLGDEIDLEDLPQSIAPAPGPKPIPASGPAAPGLVVLPDEWLDLPWREARELLLREGERTYLAHHLGDTGGRIGLTARRAGIAERSLFEKMKRHGLRKEQFRPSPSDVDDGTD